MAGTAGGGTVDDTRKPELGQHLADGGEALLVDRRDEGRWKVEFAPALTLERLDILGETPLPPYIERDPRAIDEATRREDAERYQTVYARERGAVAAPTAVLLGHVVPPM